MEIKLPRNINYITYNRAIIPLFTFLGVAGLAFSRLIENPYTVLYPSTLIAGTFLFFITRRPTISSIPTATERQTKSVLVLYFLSLTGLIFAWVSIGQQQRTPVVFFMTFLLNALTVTVAVGDLSAKRSLLLIITTGIIHRFLGFQSSALYVGIDIYAHVEYVTRVISSGSLLSIGPTKYFYTPLYHIAVGANSLLLNVPIRTSIFITVSLAVAVIPLLSIYAIGGRLMTTRAGLLAAAFYSGTDFAIAWAMHPIPTSLGIVFFSLIILLTVKYLYGDDTKQQHSTRTLLLFGVFVTILNYTHQFSLFVTVVVLGAVFLARTIYQARLSEKAINVSLISGIILYLNFRITRVGGPDGGVEFFDVVVGRLVRAVLRTSADARVQQSLPLDPSISPTGAGALSAVHVLGSAIMLTLGIQGALLLLDRSDSNNRSQSGFTLGLATGLPLIITLAGPVVGLRILLPFRWFAFIYFPLSLLAAYGFLIILKNFVALANKRHMVVVCAAAFMISFPFFMFMGGNANGAQDGPLFDEEPGAERLSTTDAELALYSHIASHRTSGYTVRADSRALAPLRHFDVTGSIAIVQYEDPDSIPGDDYLVNRAYLRSNHAQYRIVYNQDSYRVYGPFPVGGINDSRLSTVYESGEDELLIIS